jgi:hypothetical protein
MAHYQFEEDINYLEEKLTKIEEFLDQLEEELQPVKAYAPDAVNSARDTIQSTRDKLESSSEKLARTRDIFAEFVEKSEIATQLYDLKEQNPDSKGYGQYEKARAKCDAISSKLNNWISKSKMSLENAQISAEKANSRVKIALIKGGAKIEKERNRKVRINFTLPETMKNDWRSLADELSISVSQMVRNAMDVYEKSVKGLEQSGAMDKIRNFEHKMENLGSDLERKLERRFNPDTGERINRPVNPMKQGNEDKERKKKRIKGLIMMQKCLPVEKLAQTLEISEEAAENYIYELAAEGIDCTFDAGVCNFDPSQIDAILGILFALIDKM